MNQFICETCNKNFQSRYSLQEHKSLHLNIKPYVCKFCSQPSRLKGNMRKHIIAHHKDHYKNKINYVKKGNLFYKDKDVSKNLAKFLKLFYIVIYLPNLLFKIYLTRLLNQKNIFRHFSFR